jgi:hypothetical protein
MRTPLSDTKRQDQWHVYCLRKGVRIVGNSSNNRYGYLSCFLTGIGDKTYYASLRKDIPMTGEKYGS